MKENKLACSADNKARLPMMINTQNFSSGGSCAACRVAEVKKNPFNKWSVLHRIQSHANSESLNKPKNCLNWQSVSEI